MNNLINSLLHYTDEDIVYNVLLERYKRLFLSRVIFLSLFPEQEKERYNAIFNEIGEQAKKNDILITEHLINLIEDEYYPYKNELKVIAVYLVYGNVNLEQEVCSPNQLKKAREVALTLVSDHIWDLVNIV
jgi:hypothetical protein